MTFRGPQVSVLPRNGLNNRDVPLSLPDGYSPDCRNVRFRNEGVFKRDGISKYIATAVETDKPLVGIAQLILSSGTTYQVAAAGSSLVVESGGAWSPIKGGLTLTDNPNNLCQFATLTDLLIGTNNADQVWKYSGTGDAAALGGVPTDFRCKGIIEYKNYLVTLNTSESGVRRPGRFRWSDLNDPETWSAASYNDILNNAGQVGQGFGLYNDQLYAFFDRSIQEVVYTGDPNVPFVFPTVSPEIGSVSGYAIVSIDDAIFFPSYRGIYVTQGGKPQYISEPIEGTWKTLNMNRLGQIVGVHNSRDKEVWFSVSTGSLTQNDRLLVYDYVRNRWTEFDSWDANCFALFPSTKPQIPILGNYDGYVLEANTGSYSDDGSAIDGYVKTKLLRLGDIGRKKQVKRVHIVIGSEATAGAQLRVSHGYNLNPVTDTQLLDVHEAGAEWDSAVWDGFEWAQETTMEVFYRPNGHGRIVQFEFRNNQHNVGMKLSETELWIVPETQWSQAA